MTPGNQLAFFDFIIMPLYKLFADTFPVCSPLREQASANWRYWKAKATTAEFTARTLTYDMDDIVESLASAQIAGTIVDKEDHHAVAAVHRALSKFTSETGIPEDDRSAGLTSHVSSKVRIEAQRSKLRLLRATTDLEQMDQDQKAKVEQLAEEVDADSAAEVRAGSAEEQG